MAKTIVISGTVGVGKTTLIKNIKENLQNAQYFFETTVDSPYLDKYYEDIKRWAFLGQISFLSDRYEQWLKAEQDKKSTFAIFDRCVLDDYVFFITNVHQGNMGTEEQALYKEVFNRMVKIMHEDNNIPDYFFMLKAPEDKIIERMIKRGRGDEVSFDKTYFTSLYNNYYNNEDVNKFFEDNSRKFITIDASGTPEDVSNRITEFIIENEKNN